MSRTVDHFEDQFLADNPEALGLNFEEEAKFFDPEAGHEPDFLHPAPVEESIYTDDPVRVYLREILVGTPPGSDIAAAQKKAKDLADRGKKGEKFEELARNNSDSGSSQQEGDIGAYEKGKLRPEIEKTVWDQPRGYVTDPINVGNGFLILKVEERYSRSDHDTLEMTVTIDDPKTYTMPYQAAKVIYKWNPAQELEEQLCVPSVMAKYLSLIGNPADPAASGGDK